MIEGEEREEREPWRKAWVTPKAEAARTSGVAAASADLSMVLFVLPLLGSAHFSETGLRKMGLNKRTLLLKCDSRTCERGEIEASYVDLARERKKGQAPARSIRAPICLGPVESGAAVAMIWAQRQKAGAATKKGDFSAQSPFKICRAVRRSSESPNQPIDTLPFHPSSPAQTVVAWVPI